jgi:glycosyltransferase involved in cell wall biosynthesis
VYRTARRALRPLIKPHSPLPPAKRYHGHYAVVRSVVEGLEAINADFNHDPRTFSELSRIVYAPANEALRQAAQLKRRKRVDFLVAGPGNAFFPEEADNILWLPEIDILIVPSEWVRELYRTIAPALMPKMRIATAGVDAEAWKPRGHSGPSRAVVYWKSGSEDFCAGVEAKLRSHGVEPIRLRYGEHTREEFRKALDKSVFAVFLSSFETQGIALAESWSMDVPTLVWDPRTETSWRGRPFISGSSAPYLSATTGLSWVTERELDRAITDVMARRGEFRPRDWVLANMTDAICSTKLLRIIETEAQRAR